MSLEMFIGHFNYYVFILLMMTGLYIVVSRGNLIKKIIGLNIFQTSVFLLYITIGKVAGGTAPIIIGDYGASYGDKGGKEKGGDYSAHGAEAVDKAAGDKAPAGMEDASNSIDNIDPETAKAALAEASEGLGGGGAPGAEVGLHAVEGSEKAVNSLQAAAKAAAQDVQSLHSSDVAAGAKGYGDAAGGYGAETAEILYANPLPHVLILTAIVVGVATTAVGLALAVRIREAYGTIEEDELQDADDADEFGADAQKARSILP